MPMAFYEYQCEECKAIFTVSQLISEHDKIKQDPNCPECGSKHTHQLLSGFFAKTDSKT
jgi:putative FmdB family regulatory protein